MPSFLSIRDLAKETRDVAVQVADDVTITLTYRPKYYTLAFEDELAELTGAASLNAKMLCEMITNWDITGEDGGVAPITVESIKELGIPNAIVSKLIDGIVEDMRPKETRLNGSSHS